MAITGPPPKPDDERERRNAPRMNTIYAEWDGVVRGPELWQDVIWCDLTREWWEDWRRSPQSMLFGNSDWWILREAALLHNYIHSRPIEKAPSSVVSAMRELRSIVSKYGATIEDRQKLRMQFKTPMSEQKEKDFVEAQVEETVEYLEIALQAIETRKQAKNIVESP